ncbi:hypothetical protein EV214_104145 [Marinisporobacter balticus]|uniref:IPT/TIG domain-containing protein n=2 Tax=Marinisporobacter balticus TaxID=2018667 RepID=A0A4R2L7U7_9FIRM|nr:hypothetical protein EV214_104145 [Marinisporobacter balticus]
MVTILIFMGIPIQSAYADITQIKFTSSLNGTDDIKTLENNNLDVGDNIFVKFPEKVDIEGILKDKIYIYEVLKNKLNPNTTVFSYVYSRDKYVSENTINIMKEIDMDAKIVEGNEDTIEINPKEDLIPLNEYKLMIEDDISTTFWTKSASENIIPTWNVNEMDARDKKEDTQSDTKSYTLTDVPIYNMNNQPIILYVEGEVLLNVDSQMFLEDQVYQGALKNITLEDSYDSKPVGIEKYELEYIDEKTKIKLYPAYRDPNNPGEYLKEKLDSGKLYKLYIPQGTFETRGRKVLEALTLNLYTEPDPTIEKTIAYLEDHYMSIEDLKKEEKTFVVKGANFHHKVVKATLKKGNKEPLDIQDVTFKDPSRIDVHIRNEVKNKLSQDDYIGDYEVCITFDDAPLTVADHVYKTISSVHDSSYNGTDKEDKLYLHIGKGKPIVKGWVPTSKNIDEKSLKHDTLDDVTKDKYFIKLIFDDSDNKLTFSNIDNLTNCIVRPVGGAGNVVDTQFINDILEMSSEKQKTYKENYIFKKEGQQATLYIPVKALRAQTTYQVFISPDIVFYEDIYEGNAPINDWTFSTNVKPLVKEISVGSIPEDYDEDEPLYIYGDFFSSDSGKIKVYFNDIEAESVTVVSENELKVFLPEGSDRLDPGIYDIIVQNDENHKRTVNGSISVIKSGDKEDIPNEEYKIKEDGSIGEVRSNLKMSEDTLLISPSDINERELEIDLDKIMGTEVLTRKIQYEGDKRYNIGMLKTKSKWADITLYGLTLDPYAENDEIMVRIGRVEPSVTKMLKTKLRGKGIKSEFIQVTGENYKMKNIQISMSLKYSNGKNIKVLRYDEDTRSFYENRFTVNLVDKKIEMLSPYKGIFVVVGN